ncbi:RNA-binding protein [Halobacteriales archaeon SW_7_68_16]|nr:MAG: RNA-binding protein [Halobacteriales archaeon SW_7_68_16]
MAESDGAEGESDDGSGDPLRVRVRGIYTTALTRRFRAADHAVVDPSDPIEERFDGAFTAGPADTWIDPTDDDRGIGVTGTHDAVPAATRCARVADDALAWPDPTPPGAILVGTVTGTRSAGAIVDCGDREGYLPYDEAEEYVEVGDDIRVQVAESVPPWSDDRPTLSTTITVGGPLVDLERGGSGVRAAVGGEAGTELARATELLPVTVPDGWGVRYGYGAVDAALDAREAAVERAVAWAESVDAALAGESPDAGADDAVPRRIATPLAARWVWYGREARFALDEERRAVTATTAGHHRIKAGSTAASLAVDLVEGICGSGDGDLPFPAVADTFGPAVGDDLRIDHGKPDGRLFSLGTGEVMSRDGEGVTIRREIRGEGTYDGLGTPREPGDVALTKLQEGRAWYPTSYRGADGTRKGRYVNVCTPVEIFPDAARYVDLHVDVIDYPDGGVEIIDGDELAAAVDAGHVSGALADRARDVARRVKRALS